MFANVTVDVRLDTSGPSFQVPGLMTPEGLLTPLLDYFIDRYLSRSFSWMDKVVLAVRLFCEYMHANPNECHGRTLFENFAKRLYSGTFDESGNDATGLCWLPLSRDNAAMIINNLSAFFDWQGERLPSAADINPSISASAFEQRWNKAAWIKRRENALLGHLWSKPESIGVTRAVRGKRASQVDDSNPPAFPEDRFMELLTDGFRVGSRVDHRGICITLLMHGAGFRASEPFHLFIEDVVEITNLEKRPSALVRIHHPSDGAAPSGRQKRDGRVAQNRAAYLMSNFGLKPRNLIEGGEHAGWKGSFLDAKHYMQAHWFEPAYGELFLNHWWLYLEQVNMTRNHPFAFVNLTREPVGCMYKLSTFNDAHAEACLRVGLVPQKELGTTPHGHRHAYGQRLKKAKFNEKYIQTFLHHASAESQKQYTKPSLAEIASELQRGHMRLSPRPSKGQ